MPLVLVTCACFLFSAGILACAAFFLAWKRFGETRLALTGSAMAALSLWYLAIALSLSLEPVFRHAEPGSSVDSFVILGFLGDLCIPAFTYFLCRFAIQGSSAKRRNPATWLPILVTGGVACTQLRMLVRAWPRRAIAFAAMESVVDPYPLFMLFIPLAIGIFIWAWRRNQSADLRRNARLWTGFLGLSVIVECAMYLIPESVWIPVPFSRYLIDSTLIYLCFLFVSAKYLAFALKTRAKPAVFGVRSPVEAAAPDPSTRQPRIAGIDLLSEREREVVDCLLRGLRNQEIADQLFISLSTVKTHIHNILEKTGMPTRTALVASVRRD